jgi:hypothetical protein
MSARFYWVVVVGVVAVLAVTIVQIEADKSRLRRQLAPLSQSAANLDRLRADSARNRALLAQFKTSSDAGTKAIRAELIAARAELGALETKAAGSRADASATPSIEANRDPTKAMTKLDYLSNAGRATPEAAFQTLIWAALKGREPEMAACVSLDSAARAKAEGLLAGLSAEARAKYGTPEQLVGLVFSHGVLESTAFQFATSSVADGDRATLAVRVRAATGRENEMKIPMVRAVDGWSMAVGEKQIDVIRRGLTAEPPTR